MECLRDILDSRETERRKNSVFRPLNDMNFSNCERASPSYVTMPLYYPTASSAKPEWIKSITNERWVSVPYGSEES
jgi:histone deacetylase complex regulatory component SIN3